MRGVEGETAEDGVRRAARVDENQPDIIAALRRIGVSVQPLHMVGKGCPDAVIGYHKVNGLIEIKDGSKPKSEQALTKDEERWISGWRGDVVIVRSVAEALEYAEYLWKA